MYGGEEIKVASFVSFSSKQGGVWEKIQNKITVLSAGIPAEKIFRVGNGISSVVLY